MTDPFPALTLPIIRNRGTEASFRRGQDYYDSNAITKRIRHSETRLEAWVSGTELYRVEVWTTSQGSLETHCTCPYDYGGDCKHIVAVLLAWLNEPDSFKPPLDLRELLGRRRKKELVKLLLAAIEIYPDLVDDLNLEAREVSLDEPEEVVGGVFEAMEVYGHLTARQAEVRLRRIAEQAGRLARQGQGDLARRTYYAMVINCVRLFGPYGHEIITPYKVPYDFATAYVELATQQLKHHRAAIEAEVKGIYGSDNVDEMYDLMEALVDLDESLGLWGDADQS